VNNHIMQKFNVRVIGDGELTLVLGHGFGSDQTAWRYQADALASQYRLVLFDYLGCGKADIRAYDPYYYSSVKSYRNDVIEIYEALGLTKTVFIGHSVSAMIGSLVAIAEPDWISKLVFVGASPRYLNDDNYVGGFEQADLDILYETMAANYLGWSSGFGPVAIANAGHPELGKEFAGTLAAMRPDIAQSAARLIFELDLRDQLGLIEQPVLILQAQRDIVVPQAVGEYLASRIAHSQLILLNAEGHLPHLSAPDEVLVSIQNFIVDTTN